MLHSDWLLVMMEKSGPTPEARMLALYDILNDWMDAPEIRSSATPHSAFAGTADRLLDFLTRQARACDLAEPEALAFQCYCIAAGALQESLASPGSRALADARHAAATLLQAHRKAGKSRLTGAAIAAGALSLLVIAAALAPPSQQNPHVPPVAAAPSSSAGIPDGLVRTGTKRAYSPDQIASLQNALARIRQGICQYPQALMLPAESRAIFLENVVQGDIPGEASQMRDAQLLAQKVECYYPPVAMTAM